MTAYLNTTNTRAFFPSFFLCGFRFAAALTANGLVNVSFFSRAAFCTSFNGCNCCSPLACSLARPILSLRPFITASPVCTASEGDFDQTR